MDDLLSGKLEIFSRIQSADGARPLVPRAASQANVETNPAATNGDACHRDPRAEDSYSPSTSAGVNASLQLDPAAAPPPYKMARYVRTVADLWREWTEGLGSNPAVRRLEEAYGARWRTSQSERMFFGRRLVIIREIERRSGSCSEAKAIDDLDRIRVGELKNGSLHGLSVWLRSRNATVSTQSPLTPLPIPTTTSALQLNILPSETPPDTNVQPLSPRSVLLSSSPEPEPEPEL